MSCRSLYLLALMPLAAACGGDDSGVRQALSEPGVPPAQVKAWAEDLVKDRAEKDTDFATSGTSPMAGTQYLKSELADLVFLTLDDSTFDLAYDNSENAVLSMALRDGTWRWTAIAEGIACTLDDQEVRSGMPVERPAVFSVGDLTLSFYPSADRVTFIAFDKAREEMLGFEHLVYYDPDPEFAVMAELVPFDDPEMLTVPTSRDLEKTFYRYASLRFLIGGVEQRLTALKSSLEGPGSEGLFIPFRDATTGVETYGAGRFLEIDDPPESIFVLDFNRAFNPLCNYSPAYNCAIPPQENHLEVAIRAGEKTYPH